MVSDQTRAAVKLFGTYTAGRFQVWAIAGQQKASVRAHIMAVLKGVDKVPQKDANVGRLREALYAAVGVEGECEAAREESLAAKCRELLAVADVI